MFLTFKIKYCYHWSFQNQFSLIEKSMVVNRRFSIKKFLDSIIGAFIIVFPFLKNNYKPASDMTCFTDSYLTVKRTEHKWGIRYFVICEKADWWLIRGTAFWNLIGFPPVAWRYTRKTVLYSLQCNNSCLAAADVFHLFTHTINFVLYIPLPCIKSTDVWKIWFIKQTVKMNGYYFQQVLWQNLGWFLS